MQWLFLFIADVIGGKIIHAEKTKPAENPAAVEHRRQVILANSLPWPPLEGEPRGLALCFQTGGGLYNPTIWQRWLEEAYDWIHKTGLESADVAPANSSILRTFIHHAAVIDPQALLKTLPPLLKPGVVPQPAACRWGPTNPCTYRLLEHAYNSCPDCGYFYLVSDNSVPLSRFEDIYKRILEDKRMRVRLTFPVYDWVYGEFVAKASLWKGLPREFVAILADNKDEWNPGVWLQSGYHRNTMAAPDEWHFFLPLIRRFGDTLFDLIDDGSTYTSDPQFDRTIWVKDCWALEQCPGSTWSGSHYPIQIQSFNQGFLDEMYAHPRLWFFRKATDQTTVELNNKTKVMLYDYMADHLLRFPTKTVVKTTPLWLPDTKGLHSYESFIEACAKHKPPLEYLVPDVLSLKGLMDEEKEEKQY